MLTDTRAANMAEYAIIAAIIIGLAAAAFSSFGQKIFDTLGNIDFGGGQ
jgi:Flp pilus assembly pilin Flp